MNWHPRFGVFSGSRSSNSVLAACPPGHAYPSLGEPLVGACAPTLVAHAIVAATEWADNEQNVLT